ncbi:hypothetical_protein (plasmid) [Leishmania braziliensis MHOM/BR/75/M2904]|nr:hypothetical_protein [Leishmania braziliensis MHOM/BR/75/M2904]
MPLSSTLASYAESRDTYSESVEVYRRYPAPEMVHLPIITSTTTTSTSSSSSSSVCNDTEVTTSPPESTTHISLRLRWGVQATELRRVYEIHEEAYPIRYAASYYEWLLNHDACMGLVALATQEMYRKWTERWREAKGNTTKVAAAQTAYSASTSCASAAPPVPPPVSQCSMTADAVQERTLVERAIAEQERIAALKAADRSHKGANNVLNSSEGSDAAAHTVVVGFILGQMAYARHDAGHLLSNPTAYIGSFAVDLPFQTCGVGSVLLERFITYVTQQRPLYAQDYLHYDERKLIALLADAQVKQRTAGAEKLLDGTPTSAAGGVSEGGGDGSRQETNASSDAPPPTSCAALSQSSNPTSGHSSIFKDLLSTYLPELHNWMEDRQARLRLRSCGLTEDEINAQRLRDRLAPDVLTDEEADEVRRKARRFVVQTGVRDVWLHCLPGNLKATTFYAHRGFGLHRELKGYYDINGVSYDAHLLHCVCGSDEPSALPTASAELSSTLAADTLSEMDRVVEGLEHRKAPEREETMSTDEAAPLISVTPVSLPPLSSSLTGLRRRRGAPRVREDVGLTAADYALAEAARAIIPDPTIATPAAALDVPAGKATPLTQVSLRRDSWLSPRTYPMVADIILCAAEKGQEEWRRLTGPKGSDDVAGQRLGWREAMREMMFFTNALGLLCAVLWLTYNVLVTGKVE